MMLMVQDNDSAIGSYEELSEEDMEEAQAVFVDAFKGIFQKYENGTSEAIVINGMKAFECKADVRINNQDKDLQWVMLNINWRSYAFGLLVDKYSSIDYTSDFEALKNTIMQSDQTEKEGTEEETSGSF
ncbi:hypothetical protein [Clostridium sp. AM58-1XD]|uniref:hypothetical protein n=1 Tax=Clostridium sp. AM58-1XD TaxID=2292307 RepID=UPI0011C0EEA9|nr:hypothetical protein [Clostridium sp. AM58-1XD]